MGQAEQSAQPLADLFLHKTRECSDRLTAGGLLTYPDFPDPACYLAYLALPGGKCTRLDALSRPVLQQAHRCYLSHPALWPESSFRWAHRPAEALPVLAFWRGEEVLCLCNPTDEAVSLPIHTERTLRLCHQCGAERNPMFSAVPERLSDGDVIPVPPGTCLLFDHTPARTAGTG